MFETDKRMLGCLLDYISDLCFFFRPKIYVGVVVALFFFKV